MYENLSYINLIKRDILGKGVTIMKITNGKFTAKEAVLIKLKDKER